MTEEQRRQAAAQRCADLANESSVGYRANDFDGPGVAPPARAFLNAVLELDELARKVDGLWTRLPQSLVDAAKPHILPDPKPSPVERLAESYGVLPCDVVERLKHLGLDLVERKS